MINSYIKISCDWCEHVYEPGGSAILDQNETIASSKKSGWFYIGDKQFCSRACMVKHAREANRTQIEGRPTCQ